MIPAAFLICALALPPESYTRPESSARIKVKDFKELVKYMKQYAKDYEFILEYKEGKPHEWGYQETGILWEKFTVFARKIEKGA